MSQSSATGSKLASIVWFLALISPSSTAQNIAMTTPLPQAMTGSTTSTSLALSAPPKTHLVQVGAGGFHFEPAQLDNVSVGDVISFEFYPPDHSVARAEYGKEPCMPYEYTGKDKTGFWSGTQWVDTVNDVRCRSVYSCY
jgi:hypothetical protein